MNVVKLSFVELDSSQRGGAQKPQGFRGFRIVFSTRESFGILLSQPVGLEDA